MRTTCEPTKPTTGVESDRTDEDGLAAAYREASESAEALADEWDEASGEAWNGLAE